MLIVLVLFLSCACIVSLKREVDRIPRKKIPGASIIYIPSGKYLKYATFGYSSLVADLVYLWAIQYYTTYTIVDRFQNLEHIFSIIAELDPRYTDPYEIGALIAVNEAKDLASRPQNPGHGAGQKSGPVDIPVRGRPLRPAGRGLRYGPEVLREDNGHSGRAGHRQKALRRGRVSR